MKPKTMNELKTSLRNCVAALPDGKTAEERMGLVVAGLRHGGFTVYYEGGFWCTVLYGRRGVKEVNLYRLVK